MSLMRTAIERTYHRDAADAFTAFYDAAANQPGWRNVRGDKRTGIVEARTGMGMRSWGEVIQVFVQAISPGQSRVTVSSRVKLQLFDWGKNKKNVELVFSAAEASLGVQGTMGAAPSVPPPPA